MLTPKQTQELLDRLAAELREWDDMTFFIAVKDGKNIWHYRSDCAAVDRVVLSHSLLENALEDMGQQKNKPS